VAKTAGAHFDAVLTAGRQLLAEGGLEKMTIRQVASKAKVATGTVYLYFAGKEDLLKCIYETMLESLHDDLRTAIDESNSGPGAIHAVIDLYISRAIQDPNWARLLTVWQRPLLPFFSDAAKGSLTACRAEFARAAIRLLEDNPTAPGLSAKAIGDNLLSMLDGALAGWLEEHDRLIACSSTPHATTNHESSLAITGQQIIDILLPHNDNLEGIA